MNPFEKLNGKLYDKINEKMHEFTRRRRKMKHVPKEDKEFSLYIQSLRQRFLELSRENNEQDVSISEEVLKGFAKKREKFIREISTEKGRVKMRREFAKMEARRVQLQSEGKVQEAKLLAEKIRVRKQVFMDQIKKNRGM
jgi:hypothetical protein